MLTGCVSDVKQEGLFRKAGNVDRQRVLCDHLNGVNVQLNLHKEFTVHDCATVLKTFLGDMPEPLLVEKYCTAYRQVAGVCALISLCLFVCMCGDHFKVFILSFILLLMTLRKKSF